MEASADRAVILKGISVPLTVRKWDGEREILDHFRVDGRPLVRLADEDFSDKYQSRYFTVETSFSVLAIYAQIDARTAEIVQMRSPDLWLVGVDTWVFGVNWRMGGSQASALHPDTSRGDEILEAHPITGRIRRQVERRWPAKLLVRVQKGKECIPGVLEAVVN